MNKLNATSSQKKPREELGQENIWDEDIWAEIFHDENGETVLRNITRNDPSNGKSKLQTIDFEDTNFEDEKNTRPKHQQIVFIRPKKDSATPANMVDKDKVQTNNSTPGNILDKDKAQAMKSSISPGFSSQSCENTDEESYRYKTHDARSFDGTKCEKFVMTDLSGNILDRKHENPNLFKPSSMELQPNTNSTKRQEILSNTPSAEKATKHEPSSKALRQNWFTTSSCTNRFKTSSTEPVKPDEQESCPLEPQITQQESLGKRLRNAIRPKVLAVSPGFKAVTETPVLELDTICRPSQAQEIEGTSWTQPDRRCVCKRFGAKAEKYVVCDEMESTKIEAMGLENGLVDVGATVDKNDVGTGTCRSKWSKLKFWKTGLFSSRKTISPQVSQEDQMNDSECDVSKSNKNARVADYYQMVEQRGCE